MYLNGLLASLNARDQFRKPVSDTEDSIDAGYQLSRIGIHSSGSKAAPTHLVNVSLYCTCQFLLWLILSCVKGARSSHKCTD